MDNVNTLGIVVLVIGFIGSFLITVSFLPLTWELLKTKQTHTFSTTFGIAMLLSGIFWIIYAILVMNTSFLENNTFEALIKGLPLLITNIVRIISHGINLYLKIKVIFKAKKQNMTEKQYCDVFYENLLMKKQKIIN